MGTELATATVHPAELIDDRQLPAPTSTDARTVTAERAALLVAEWLVGKAGPTVTAYRADLDAFAAYLVAMADELGARPPADAPEAVAVLLSRSKGEAASIATAYRQWMEAPTDDRPKLAPSTVGRRLAALSSLVATAYRSDLIGWELTLKGPKVVSYRDTRGPGADAVADMVEALKSGQVGGYGTDVLDSEPPTPDHPLLKLPNVVCTPHIGSRTYESVERQALRATHNMINYLNGDPDFIQANKF